MTPEEAKKFSSALKLLNEPDVRPHHEAAIWKSIRDQVPGELAGVNVFDVLAAAGYVWKDGDWRITS